MNIIEDEASPIIEVMGSSGKVYRVDTVNGRCSCPAWKFSRGGSRGCKHLKALGIESHQGGEMIPLPEWAYRKGGQ